MPKSAFVHIGVGKTGTTSIQAVLGGLARRGRLHGIAVPSVGGRDQVYLAAAYQPPDRLPRAVRGAVAGEPDSFRETLRSQWIAAIRDRPSIVVSSEFLALFSDEEVAAFRNDLAEAGYETLHCLVYVREPAGLYLSSVQQSVKASGSFSHPARFDTRYKECIGRWRSMVDPNLTVRLFRKSALVAGDVVIDFLTQFAEYFGVDRPVVRYARRNESLSAEGMILMQKYRRHVHPEADDWFLPDSNRLLDMVTAIEPRLTRAVTAPRLREEVKRIVYRRAAGDIAYLSEEFGIDMSAEASGADHESEASSFADVADILTAYDPAALDELYDRLLGVLLRSVPA